MVWILRFLSGFSLDFTLFSPENKLGELSLTPSMMDQSEAIVTHVSANKETVFDCRGEFYTSMEARDLKINAELSGDIHSVFLT